jgi:hypothetical protein
VSLQRLRAAVSLALGRAGAFLAGHLDDERSTLNSVNKNEARLEAGVRGPGTEESDGSAALILIIFGVHVDETCFTHACASGILRDRGRVDYVQAVTVVGLVEKAIEDVLVVVDGASSASVVPGVHGVLEIADVEDVGGWQTLGHRANLGVTLIKLVVHEEVLLVHFVVDNTLMDVLSTGEGCYRDDVGGVANLVRCVVDGDGVFVVAVADVTAFVPLVRATVDQTFGVMDISITSCTARTPGVGGVGHVEVDQTTAAGEVTSNSDGLVTANRSNGNGVVQLLVYLHETRSANVDLSLRIDKAKKTYHNVVCTAHWKLVPVTSKVGLREVRGASRIQFKQLLHVKDLNSMVDGFGADDSMVTEDSDLSPVGANGIVLRKTTKVDQLALGADFCERSAVVLANGDELATTVGGPSPARGSTSVFAAKIGV